MFTGPSNIAAKIIPQLTAEEKQKLQNIRYQGIVCASVLMKESLSPFYVTNITDETPFTGIIEMSALVDKAEFGGRALVYLPKYVAPDDELFERTDAEIEETFLSALEKMYPHFDRKGVEAFKISRVRQVFPLPVLDYSAYLPSINTSVDGFVRGQLGTHRQRHAKRERNSPIGRKIYSRHPDLGAMEIPEKTDENHPVYPVIPVNSYETDREPFARPGQ